MSARLLDRELDRDPAGGRTFGSKVCASASGLVCALGVADQSRAGGTDVWIGGGEIGL